MSDRCHAQNYAEVCRDGEGSPAPWPRQLLDVLTRVDQADIAAAISERLAGAAKTEEATKALEEISCKVKFLIWSPRDGDLTAEDLSFIDWIVFEGQAANHDAEASEGLWRRTEAALRLARENECRVYFASNFTVRPQEYPAVEERSEALDSHPF